MSVSCFCEIVQRHTSSESASATAVSVSPPHSSSAYQSTTHSALSSSHSARSRLAISRDSHSLALSLLDHVSDRPISQPVSPTTATVSAFTHHATPLFLSHGFAPAAPLSPTGMAVSDDMTWSGVDPALPISEMTQHQQQHRAQAVHTPAPAATRRTVSPEAQRAAGAEPPLNALQVNLTDLEVHSQQAARRSSPRRRVDRRDSDEVATTTGDDDVDAAGSLSPSAEFSLPAELQPVVTGAVASKLGLPKDKLVKLGLNDHQLQVGACVVDVD